MTARGFAGRDPFFEDWGRRIPLDHDAFALRIGCGNPKSSDGFLCFIEPSKPTVRELSRKIDTSECVAALAEATDATLCAHLSIQDLRW
jgi:hypothetical protein